LQVRLLRVLQEKVYEPLGSVEPVKVDARVVVATNRELGRLLRSGKFREDLYYRINVLRMELPPLRERREDIPLLVEHFIRKFNHRRDREISGLSEEALQAVMEHDYPGNIRELENIIEHAFVLCQDSLVGMEHLPAYLRRPTGGEGVLRSGITLRNMERIAIADALRKHGGNRTAAARELGVDPSTLFRKIKSLRISLPERDGRQRRK